MISAVINSNKIVRGILSRKQVERIGRNPNYYLKNTLLISILNPIEDSPNNIKPLPKHILHRFRSYLTVRFFDVEQPVDDKIIPITDDIAEKIAKFILKYKDNLGKKYDLLVHCEAGISRSAAVAMATECIVLYDCDIDEYLVSKPALLTSDEYNPNMFVFRKIVEIANSLRMGGK